MDPLRLLAYIVALIIVVAVTYTLLGGAFEQRYTPIPAESMAGLDYKPKRIECPSTNSSNVDAYHVDFLKILGGVDLDYIFNVNLSNLNVTRYLIEYAKLGLLIPIGFAHNGSAYELHMLPVSENDEENLTSKAIYLCFPPRVLYPLFVVRNSTSELFIKNATVRRDIPVLGRGDYETWVNVVTPPPYAELNNVTVGVEVLERVAVEGFVNVYRVDASFLYRWSAGPWCYNYTYSNVTYVNCYTYGYSYYNISWFYSIGYKANGSVAYSKSVSGSRTVGGGYTGDVAVHKDADGYYAGLGPLAMVEVAARFSVDSYRWCNWEGNTTYLCNYHYEYYLESAQAKTYARGLRVATTVNTSIDFEPTQVTGVEPINISIQRHTVLRPRGVALLPVEFYDSIDMCSYLGLGDMYAVRCLSDALGFKPARRSFAGYLELRYVVKDFDWPWGSVVDLPYEIAVEKKLYPPPYAPDVDLNRMFYGYLQEAVLKHIANIVDGYATRTGYREFEAWALSTQVPIQMGVCDDHSYSYMSLVEALSDGCGSDLERAEILSRILSNLNIMNEVKDVTVRTARGLEVVNATGKAVAGYIDSYPPFYNLTGIGCAKEVNGKYMVVYDTVQNSVFSVIDRIEVGL